MDQGSNDNEPAKQHKVRRYRRRVRRLAPSTNASEKNPTRCQRILTRSFKVIFYVLLANAIYFMKNSSVLDDLKHLSVNQYQLYLYGRSNYCHEQFDHRNITIALRKRVYGQENVISTIEAAFRQHENITTIALLGSQGVGKSLTLNTIQATFQWHLNVQQYIWSAIDSREKQLKRLLKMLDQLSTCGQNGIFIDDIRAADVGIVVDFHRELMTRCQQHQYKVLVIFVFQEDNKNDREVIQGAIKTDLVKLVQFRRFDSDDVRNCIAMESDRLHLRLTPAEIDETLRNIDTERNGCKMVAAKIALHTLASNSKRTENHG